MAEGRNEQEFESVNQKTNQMVSKLIKRISNKLVADLSDDVVRIVSTASNSLQLDQNLLYGFRPTAQ